MSRQVQGQLAPAAVVAAFNVAGYQATFAAVAKAFPKLPVTALYAAYPSKEALGEAWLSGCVPAADQAGSVGALFGECTFRLLSALNEHRDFSQAWLAAIRRSGTRLEQLESLSSTLQGHYEDWLLEHADVISLPNVLIFKPVLVQLAEALRLATLRLIASWETDKSPAFAQTSKRVDATTYLLDGLLTARDEFGGRGLLVHMVDLFDVPSEDLLGPVMDLMRKPDRGTRLLQLLLPPSGNIVQPLLGIPDRAKHLVELLARELRAADQALR
jgi:hypothetical protein